LVAFVSPIGVSAAGKDPGAGCFAVHPNENFHYLPIEEQQKLINLDNELNAIDLSKSIEIQDYGWSGQRPPKWFEDKMTNLKAGQEVSVNSLEEAKLLIQKTGVESKHGKNWIDPPHTDSNVAKPSERIYYHINTNEGVIILPFIQ
jgi:hypothetical protein